MTRTIRLELVLVVALCRVAAAHDRTELRRLADERYDAADFAACGELYRTAAEHEAGDPVLRYNAACCLALAGRTDAAIAELAAAVRNGFSDHDLLRGDTDLASLHAHPSWTSIVDECERRTSARAAFWESPAWRSPFADDLPDQEKIAGLSRLWSEVKFNFANFDLVPDVDWDALFVGSVPAVLATGTTEEYYRVLMRLCARLRDGHTYVRPPPELFDRFNSRPALRTSLVDERVLIVRIEDPALLERGLTVGQEILSVDGRDVREHAETRVAPFVSASTPQDRGVRIWDYALLTGPASEPVTIGLPELPGTVVLPRLTVAERARRFGKRPAYEAERVAGNVLHVRLNSFDGPAAADAFVAAFDEISNADGLVLDVRDNGGGNSEVGYRVLATLTDRPFERSRWWTRSYRPVDRAWNRNEGRFLREAGTVSPNGDLVYRGPVVVLTSARTYSAAEDFCVAFDAMGRGPIVGETTGGSTGQPLTIRLPGGGSARICTKRDLYPDGTEFVGRGVAPDRRLAPTVEDVRTGRDPVLQAALEEIRRAGRDTRRR